MSDLSKESDVYVNEHRLLARAKEIANNHSLSKNELLKENAALVNAYEALLQRCAKPNRNDAQPIQRKK